MSIIPLSLLSWQEAIRLQYLDKVVAIDFYSDWIVHSSSCSMAVPAVVMTKQFYEKATRIRFTKTNVLLRDQFTCQYCNKQFHGSELTLDHYVPKSRNGKKNWENILTCCGPCNWSRGNDETIKPIRLPKKPTYHQLVNNRKKYPIFLPCKSWNDYLGWDEHLITNKPIIGERFKFKEK